MSRPRRRARPTSAIGPMTPCGSTAGTCGRRSSARAATSASRSSAGSSTRPGGGRINTDAIDNSAGVDCSDHEVNLKILLALAVERGELTTEGRDELLQAVADRRGRPRPLRQLPAGADPLPGDGRLQPPDGGLRGPDAANWRQTGILEAAAGVPAQLGADGRAGGRRARHGAAGAVRSPGIRQAAAPRPGPGIEPARRSVPAGVMREYFPPAVLERFSALCPISRCAGS